MADNYLVIRADADNRIGSGHVIRCLALAQAWQDRGGKAVFITSCADTPLGRYLAQEGFAVFGPRGDAGSKADAELAAGMIREYGGRWLAADGYAFGEAFQRRIKKSGASLLVIDDYGSLETYLAEIVLNQNPSAQARLYPEGPRLLLGTRYALLRRQFQRWTGWQREISRSCDRILVTLGGADPENVTSKVLEALGGITRDKLEIKVVISASHPHAGEIETLAAASPHRVSLERDVRAMDELMVWADLAVSAGGSTCWEMAFLGLPNIIFVLAENQRQSAEAIHNLGVSINLGAAWNARMEGLAGQLARLCVAPDLRRVMSERGRALVDGRGASRVVEVLMEE